MGAEGEGREDEEDVRKAIWCATLIGLASERAMGEARDAAAADGGDGAEGEREASQTALQAAARAIGRMRLDEHGEPEAVAHEVTAGVGIARVDV